MAVVRFLREREEERTLTHRRGGAGWAGEGGGECARALEQRVTNEGAPSSLLFWQPAKWGKLSKRTSKRSWGGGAGGKFETSDCTAVCAVCTQYRAVLAFLWSSRHSRVSWGEKIGRLIKSPQVKPTQGRRGGGAPEGGVESWERRLGVLLIYGHRNFDDLEPVSGPFLEKELWGAESCK